MGTILIGMCVAIAALLVVWALAKLAFLLSILVERWLSEAEKDRHFNIMYMPKYGSEFYRAHLVGKVDRPNNSSKVSYLVEIHPEDADKADVWTVREAEIRGGHLLEKGRFYRYALKEELYD